MLKQPAKDYLGCQIWVEPDDSPERIDGLVRQAAETGFGWLRTFLMWPFIEAEPGKWDFAAYDLLFDAAAKYGIKLKATLTANSGPWHIGTPSVLHSHTGFLNEGQWPAMERYIEQCVTRYRAHPALGQWILWNEPSSARERSDQARRLWQGWLKERYQGDLAALNRRWRTGYTSFEEAQFPEELVLPVHTDNVWHSYRPYMDEARFSMRWLEWELQTIEDTVRRFDKQTPTCVNPAAMLNNSAAFGLDLGALSEIVDYLGASYHPCWHFEFTSRDFYPALMSTGVKKAIGASNRAHIEVTEIQSGNSYNSARNPVRIGASELARFYLASLFAGAESATGWLLNTRSYDFESGDWGLLDNFDRPSPRSQMIRRLHDVLARVDEVSGGHEVPPPDVLVGYSQVAQIQEYIDSGRVQSVPGNGAEDGALGGALLNVLCLQCGANASLCRLEDIPADGAGKTLLLSHQISWDAKMPERILRFAESGGTVAFDAHCGRKDGDAHLYRPWPGGIAEKIGLTICGLETDLNGYRLSLLGEAAGQWILARSIPDFDPRAPWKPWEELRFEADGAPCVWERGYGNGRFVFVNGLIAPSVLHKPNEARGTKYFLQKLLAPHRLPVRPAAFAHGAFALALLCQKGTITAILANSAKDRGAKPLQIFAPEGEYLDLWSGQPVRVPQTGIIPLPAEDGIALLWHA